nr:uncharacterized protein LOC112722915 [Arachis hypogaea]
MVKKNFSSSYQKVQDAKKRSRARVDAAKAVGTLPPPPPPPHNLGTSFCSIMVPSSSTSSLLSPPPPPRSFHEPEKKKRKTSGSFLGAFTFDGPQFVQNHVFPHTSISMEDAMVRNQLNVIVQGSVRAAGVCTKLLDILEKTLLSSLGSAQKVEEFEGRIFLYQEEEKRLKEEVAKLKEEKDQLWEREKKLMGQCAMAEGLKEKAEQNYIRLFTKNLDLKKELAGCRDAFQDLEDSIAEGAQEAWRIIVDGAIVSPPRPETDSDLKTKGHRIVESSPRQDRDLSCSSVAPSQGPGHSAPSSPGAAPISLPVDPSSGGGDLPSGNTENFLITEIWLLGPGLWPLVF